MTVGFIGLGIMGSPMALNLVRAGYALGVYNRTTAKCAALANTGAHVYDSATALAAQSDVVITMVSDTADVEAVIFGANGAAEGLKPGGVVIDMSTIAPSAAEQFADRLRSRSIEMLDAPVSGGEAGAKAATLSIMVGGKDAVFQRCLPVLQAMGKNVILLGPNGSGQKTKLVNQIVGAITLLATVEGLRVARAAGLDLPQVHEAIRGGAAASWMLSNLGPKIIAQDSEPGFSIRLQAKDLRLAADFVRELDLEAPGTSLVSGLFEAALQKGLANQGNQGLYNLWPESH
jgi:3-hydroxyisobutyrate dehydrogenase-like beta-hydroxyacid dehydrogenase